MEAGMKERGREGGMRQASIEEVTGDKRKRRCLRKVTKAILVLTVFEEGVSFCPMMLQV